MGVTQKHELRVFFNADNNKCASIEAWLKAIALTSTRHLLHLLVFDYKSKENCLILRTEGLKIKIQNKRLELFIKDE